MIIRGKHGKKHEMFFCNFRLIRWIQQNKNYQKTTALAKNWTQIT